MTAGKRGLSIFVLILIALPILLAHEEHEHEEKTDHYITTIGIERVKDISEETFRALKEKRIDIAETRAHLEAIKILLLGIFVMIVFFAFYHGQSPALLKLRNFLQKFDYYTLGSITGFLFFMLILSGAYLALFFSAHPFEAHQSVMDITKSPVGWYIRNFHLWAAEAFVFIMLLHATRVVITRANLYAKKWNYYIGLVLLALALGSLLTGTMLKVDQEGYEAFAHLMAAIALVPGGNAVANFFTGPLAVMRLFVIHIFLLPVAMLFLVPIHVALQNVYTKAVSRWKKSAVYSAVVLMAIMFLSAVSPAPLFGPAIAHVEITKPPWMYYWLYGLENIMGMIGMIIGPAVAFAVLFILPSLVETNRKYRIMDVIYFGGMAIIIILGIYAAYSGVHQHIFMGGMHAN